MIHRTVRIILCTIFLSSIVAAGDWSIFGHDNCRSNATDEQLTLPLKLAWTFESAHAPQPAWPAPARQDFFHHHFNLRPTVDYDRAFHVTATGESIFFGSSADDKVYALDSTTGRQRWAFFTEGPIRFAPALANGRLYVGSDDGCVYCLDARDGSLLWKYEVAGRSRMIPGNDRMISVWPVRTGLVVENGKVYFAAGLFPKHGAYLFALDAEDGSVLWRQKLDISPQGYILASDDRLYVPTGRTNPAIFARANGKPIGQLSSAGGAYALLTEDALVTGPGRGAKQLEADDIKSKDRFATFGGLRMIVSKSVAYMQSETQLSAFDRGRYFKLSREVSRLEKRSEVVEKQLKSAGGAGNEKLRTELRDLKTRIGRLDSERKTCYLWKTPCEHSDAMIMAGDTLFLGGENRIAAVNTKTGDVLWNAPVEGRALGLSVSGGSLLVSTDNAKIHCFRNNVTSPPGHTKPKLSDNPYPHDCLSAIYSEAAEYLVAKLDSKKGYCMVLDSGKGRLAYELARRTQMIIIGVEEDADKVAFARNAMDAAGLAGRVTIHHRSGQKLSYTSFFANLIVSDAAISSGKLPATADDVLHLARPYGGLIAIAQPNDKQNEAALTEWGKSIPDWKLDKRENLLWGLARRPALPNAGEWTHMYAEPGNSACSNDRIVAGQTAIQWFGPPGPEQMIDRHHRNVPPLCKDGRLFVPGDCVVYAIDAYNGAIIWETQIPDSRRLGAFLDCGSMALDERSLYVAVRNECHAFNVKTGQCSRKYSMPQITDKAPHVWGYIASLPGTLLASGCKPNAAYTETSYDADESLWYRGMKVVTSDYLFTVNKGGSEPGWKYEGGLILNTTISISDGRLYFVETSSPKALAEKSGRMPVKTLFDGGEQHIVSLDIKTGNEIYRKKLDTNNVEEPVYLSCTKGVLLFSGSRLIDNSVRYYYQAFAADSGDELWETAHDTGLAKDGGHGEYNRHPTIVGDTVYAWPYAYDLKTGAKLQDWKMDRRGHGCGGISASANCIFWRGGNPWMYELGPEGGPDRLNTVTRPGCWINMIPAGGLVLIPEASSGCTCGFPLQTSLAYIPEKLLN